MKKNGGLRHREHRNRKYKINDSLACISKLVEVYVNATMNILTNVQRNTPGLPVAEHFNTGGHSLNDVFIRAFDFGSNCRRKHLKMGSILGSALRILCGLKMLSIPCELRARAFKTLLKWRLLYTSVYFFNVIVL